MRVLAKSSMLRIAAVLVLLAIRPSMIVLGMALLNDFSDSRASLQYIDDDLEAHQLCVSRQTWSYPCAAKIHVPAAVYSLSGRHFPVPVLLGPISAHPESDLSSALHIPTASRSPPI